MSLKFTKHSEKTVTEIIRCKNAGMMDKDIAKQCGVKFTYVRNVIRRFRSSIIKKNSSDNPGDISTPSPLKEREIALYGKEVNYNGPVTEEEKAQVLELRQLHLNSTKIAQKLGKTISRIMVIYKHLPKLTKEEAFFLRKKHDPKLEARAVELRQKGLKLDDIGLQLNVPPGAAKSWISKFGVTLSKEQRTRALTDVSEEQVARALQLRTAGVSILEVAKKVGITKDQAIFLFRKHGVKLTKTQISANMRTLVPEDFDLVAKELKMQILDYQKDENGRIKVKCHCGMDFYPKAYYFLSKSQISCGCVRSKPQRDLAEFVKSLGFSVLFNDRTSIAPFELDIYIPEKNLAIEYNGLFWHGQQNLGDRAVSCHKNKYERCKEARIRLIQIFSDEWIERPGVVKSKIKSILGIHERRIGARECELVVGKALQFRGFLEQYHLQGYASGVGFGLRLNDELVAVLSAKQIGDGVWDINRYCVKEDLSVAGGFSRLLSKLKESVKWGELITFADLRWSDGHLYETNGFRMAHTTAPSYWYFDASTDCPRFHKSHFRKEKIEQRFDIHIEDGITEWEIMQDLGYDRVWDAGKQKWILERASLL